MGAIAGPVLSLDGLHGLHGWQWLFLVTGLPAVMVGLIILFFLPDTPATARWLSEDESDWLQREMSTEAETIGEPASHNILAALANPVVLRLGIIGLLTIGSSVTLGLSVPLLLNDETGLDTTYVGLLTSLGSLLSVVGTLACGMLCDRLGDRYGVLLASTAGVGLVYLVLALGLGHSSVVVVGAYLVWMFVYVILTASSIVIWPDLLHPRQLAVGGAAINTMCQIGGFIGPYMWGVAKDATGSFTPGLYGLVVANALAWLIVFFLARRARCGSGAAGFRADT